MKTLMPTALALVVTSPLRRACVRRNEIYTEANQTIHIDLEEFHII